MTDDQTDVKEVAGEDASIETPSVEEPKAPGEEETPTEAPEAPVEETETETGEAPKKGANARIRELNAKAKSAEEKAKGLEQRLAELTGSGEPSVPRAPQQPQIEGGQEITPEQYQQDVTQRAMSAAQLIVAQSNAVNRINSEAKEAITKYPQLDPDSEQFDSELSESVTEATLAYVKGAPYTASPKAFVEKMMKPYQRSVTKKVGQETENIAKQVSESASRPTSVTTKGAKTYEDMSIQELEKTLGVHTS